MRTQRLKLLAICFVLLFFGTGGFCQELKQEDQLKKKVDSLFILACGGLEKYRDKQQSAESTLVQMGEKAILCLLEKLNTQSARERWTLIRIFGKIGDPAVLPVIGKLDSDNKDVVKLSIRILGEIKDNRAVKPLVRLLNRNDYNIRSLVCESLGRIADTTAFKEVSSCMEDSVEVVRKSAAVALGRMKDERAIPYLIRGLSDPHFSVRMSSANSLVQMGNSTVEPLLFLLDHSTGTSLYLAIESLGKLKAPKALPLLLEKLKEEDWAVRAFTVQALCDIDDQRGIQAIKKMKKEATHPFVLNKIKQCLEKMR